MILCECSYGLGWRRSIRRLLSRYQSKRALNSLRYYEVEHEVEVDSDFRKGDWDDDDGRHP
jgi:hypothetical protein